MTNAVTNRHIVPCRHKGAEKRIYVVWKGDDDGKTEMDSAMTKFGETEYDGDASPAEHFKKIVAFLLSHGFEEIKA